MKTFLVFDVHGVISDNTNRMIRAVSSAMHELKFQHSLNEEYDDVIKLLEKRTLDYYFSNEHTKDIVDGQPTIRTAVKSALTDLFNEGSVFRLEDTIEQITRSISLNRDKLYEQVRHLPELVDFISKSGIPYVMFTNGDENAVYDALKEFGIEDQIALTGTRSLESENFKGIKGVNSAFNVKKPSGFASQRIERAMRLVSGVYDQNSLFAIIGDSHTDVAHAKDSNWLGMQLIKSEKQYHHIMNYPDPDVHYIMCLEEAAILAKALEGQDLTLEQVKAGLRREQGSNLDWVLYLNDIPLYRARLNPERPGPSFSELEPLSAAAYDVLHGIHPEYFLPQITHDSVVA